MHEIKIELSEQEYQDALAHCNSLGLPETIDGLTIMAKKAIVRGELEIPTKLGVLQAWAYDQQVGIAFIPDGVYELVDLAMSKYVSKEDKIETLVYDDIMTADYTREFSFTIKDINKAFNHE